MKVDIKVFYWVYWILHFYFKTFSSRVLYGGRVTRSLVLCVCFVDHCLSFCTFFFWPLCCLFFFAIHILITPLIYSNSSSNAHSFFIVHCIIDLSLYMFFFVVLVWNYFHKQTLFRSASTLTTIRMKSTPVYPLKFANGANGTTANMVTPLYRILCLLN